MNTDTTNNDEWLGYRYRPVVDFGRFVLWKLDTMTGSKVKETDLPSNYDSIPEFVDKYMQKVQNKWK